MFKRFKKVLVCALALSMALTVTACGSDDRGGSGRKTTINFYTWGNTNDQVLMGQVEEAFEKAYPQYDINYEFAAGGVYSDNVIQKIGGGNAPDIFHVEPSNFALFAKSGLLADMSPYIGQELEDDLFPLNDGYRYDASTGTIGEGGLHALIKDWCCSFPLVFNKGLVEQYNTRTGKYAGIAGNDQIVIPDVTLNADGTANIPDPLKWSEFVEIAKKLTVNKGGQGAVYGTTMDYVPYMHLQEFIEQTGYSWFTEDESEMEINAGVREAFEYYTDLTKGESAPSPSGSALSVGGEMFANEQVATVFYGSWAVPSYNWVGKGIDIGIAPAPMPDSAWDGDQAPRPILTSGAVAMSIYAGTTEKKKEGAYKFLEFYMTEGAKIMASSGFNIPATQSAAEKYYLSEEYVTDPNILKYNKIFMALGRDYTTLQYYNPRISGATIDTIFGTYLGNWVEGKIATMDELLNTIKEEIDKAITED